MDTRTKLSSDEKAGALVLCCEHQALVEQLNATIAELQQRTAVDGLTGAATRGVLEEAGHRELSRFHRFGHPVSLVFCDIDCFKAVNDSFGHAVGDEVLKAIAGRLMSQARDVDVVGRLGGEEFVVLLPNAGAFTAAAIAERMRDAIAGLPIQTAGRVTASFGVAQALPSDAWQSWLARADEAMYRAKRSGRNRVELAAVSAEPFAESLVGGFLHLVWRPVYCSGHPVIDEQHATLFSIANELLDAATHARRPSDLLMTLKALLAECRVHFADEEDILRSAGYPSVAEHAAVHGETLARAERLYADCASNQADMGAVLEFVARDLVAGHMLREDRRHFPYLRA